MILPGKRPQLSNGRRFAKLFAQPVYRETLSGGEKELNDHLGGAVSPTLSAFGQPGS